MASSSSSSFSWSAAPPEGATSIPSSRLHRIFQQHEDMNAKMDELERRMDENISRKRRRIANLLDETSTHRESHLRLFVTHHHHQDDKGMNSSDSAKNHAEPAGLEQQQHPTWTLVVEGKLLVGHLDHQSVERIEQEAREKALQQHQNESGSVSTGSTTGAAASSTQQTSTQYDPHHQPYDLLTRSTDRTLYRGKNEQEGEGEVEPIQFTHFFDKMTTSFQTVYQPIVKQQPKPKSPTPTKGRTPKSKKSPQAVVAVDESLLRMSEPSTLMWNRPPSVGEARRFYDATAATSRDDAHAFFLPYRPPPPPNPSKQEVHSVVAMIELYPRPGAEPTFLCSSKLADALLPQHSPIPRAAKSTKKKSKKKRRRSSPVAAVTDEEMVDDKPPIPMENDMFVPPTVRMKDVTMGLFTYIQQHKLCDKNEPSVIVCDDRLQSLFECERLNFADVQQLLLSKGLVTDASSTPVTLTYIMTKNSVSPTLQQQASMAKQQQQQQQPALPTTSPPNIPSMLSFDMGISVPSLFPNRARELMRRIKRREFEYTNSRTRARNLLMRAHDDTCRTKIDDCVVGRGFAAEYVPVLLALAKGAPPMSEARASAQMDAKTCRLLDELEQHVRAAKEAWDVVDACRGTDSQATL